MAATHVILRAMQAAGVDLQPGEQIDASEWRNTANLVRARYLRPVTSADHNESPVTIKRPRGREVPHAKQTDQR